MTIGERQTNYNALAYGQRRKKELTSGSIDSITLSSQEATLAFGIPKQSFSDLEDWGGGFVIEPRKDGIIVRVISIEGWRKGLWERVKARGQDKSRSSQKDYEFLYLLTQAVVREDGESLSERDIPEDLQKDPDFTSFWTDLRAGNANQEGNAKFLQNLLRLQWTKLGRGGRNSFSSRNMNPQDVLGSMGID